MNILLEDTKYDFEEGVRAKQLVRLQTRLHENGEEFSIKRSHYLTGLNKSSGKRWYRWQTSEVAKMRRGKRGQMVPYLYSGGKSYGGWHALSAISFNVAGGYRKVSPETAEILASKDAEIRATQDRFPLAVNNWEFSPCANPHDQPRGSFDLMQCSPAEATVRLFGSSRYRKDLVKAVAQTDFDMVMLASTMKDRVPTDWIINFLNSIQDPMPPYGRRAMDYPLKFRPIALGLDNRSLRRLMFNTEGIHRYTLNDVIRFSDRVALDDIRKWGDLHEGLFRGRERRVLAPTTPPPPPIPVAIPITSRSKDILDAFEGSEYELIIPKGTEDLMRWSNEMNNCIRGYDKLAAAGDVHLGAVVKNERMIANYEVSKDGRLKQLLGKYNQSLDDKTRKSLERIFEKAGVTVDEYWGRVRA